MATGDEPWPVYRYPGIAPVTVDATGRYQVRRIDGKWWFVDPAGHAFLFIGVNGVGPQGAPDARRQFPYRKLVMQKYRNLDSWAESAAQRLRQWGFNAHATGHLGKENEKDAIRRQPLWFAHLVMFGELFWRKNGDILLGNKDKWQSVPNFFRPDYETFCDEMAHRLAAKLCRNPWFIGFMLDNERNWEGPVPFTQACWRRPAADPAKRAFVDFARRYTRGRIDRFNQIWGTELES
ncbi:MAG: hypothetical protein D6820_10770, partial [Lentisphaerae bacterium]